MPERITEKMLYMKLYNHNAYTNHPLDIDSLGAGGGMGDHLIFLGTQNKLGPLMTKSQLWDLIGGIGDYEYQTTRQRKNPIKIWDDEYKRIDQGGKIDSGFIYDLVKKGIKSNIKNPVGEYIQPYQTEGVTQK